MTHVTVRQAVVADAAELSRILHNILMTWNSDRPSNPAHVVTHYVEHPDRLSCAVAVDGAGGLVGFQSLKRARPGNVYDLPPGWGIIGTYVAADNVGRGVGKALFSETLNMARGAGLGLIDATIGERNEVGLAYYEALGFRTYRRLPGAIGKQYQIKGTPPVG